MMTRIYARGRVQKEKKKKTGPLTASQDSLERQQRSPFEQSTNRLRPFGCKLCYILMAVSTRHLRPFTYRINGLMRQLHLGSRLWVLKRVWISQQPSLSNRLQASMISNWDVSCCVSQGYKLPPATHWRKPGS